MSRLASLFEDCGAEGRSALIGYLPTGFPDVPTSISAMTALVESGCDIIEVGIAYSDPGMDGPVIAAATEAALRGGPASEAAFRAAADAELAAAEPLRDNAFKVPLARNVLVSTLQEVCS